ncbi:MAG: hypothetical protein DRR19_07795 [Candidatus Parabeggiatoa sp. nov. 1]|nr:MAG: hypothetical protein DRR19_07795 [Gammaproteobacteria bacterium]
MDCLRGTYRIDTVKVVHDFGNSLNPVIDKGQVEGALVQGIGWMTIEELMYADNGWLLTNSLANYTIPDIRFAPDIHVYFLDNSDNPHGRNQKFSGIMNFCPPSNVFLLPTEMVGKKMVGKKKTLVGTKYLVRK